MIEISCQPFYREQDSRPNEQRFMFAYTITIRNTGKQAVQLLSRYWLITHSEIHREEVSGEGVIGQTPVIQPGGEFVYTSGCLLKNPVGTMQGSYDFVDEAGRKFSVPIPKFVLAIPRTLH
jgi:ApaG protein